MTIPYGFVSKAYPFGNPPGGTPPVALPTKLYAVASYGVGVGERVVLKVTLGKRTGGAYVYKTLLDVSNVGGTLTHNTPSLLDAEVGATDIAPATVADWALVLKAEIHAAPETPPPFTATERVVLYTYKEGGRNVVYLNNPPSGVGSTAGLAMSEELRQAMALSPALTRPAAGVQVQFRAKGTPLVFTTVVSGPTGRAEALLPPGSYDVTFTGQGFTANDAWTGGRALTVGVSDTATRFGGSLDTTVSNAEFAVIKERMASLRWIGYIVPEDFTAERKAYWNPSVDAAYLGTDPRLPTDFADIYFGRMFRGNSWVEYIGVGTDPGV